jgi:hypothetical protein
VGAFLLVSAGLKLGQPGQPIEALRAVRVPASWRKPVLGLLVVGEAGTAVLLLTRGGWLGPVAAAVMLGALTAFLALIAVRAPSAPCGCLGDLGFGDQTVAFVRNGMLLALLAVGVVSRGAPSLVTVAAGAELAILVIVLTEGVHLLLRFRAWRVR